MPPMMSRWCSLLLCGGTVALLVQADDEGSPRIVGGIPALEGEFDFFGIPNPFFCGGSLIHPEVFLTAAHCECSYVERATEIHFGSTERLVRSEALDIVPLANERVRHPGYKSSTLENDMLLLKLSRPVDSSVEPAVWATSEPSSGDSVTAIGFGATSQSGGASQDLLKVTVPVVGFSTCNSGPYYDGDVFEEEMVCAGAEGIDSCQGDSGGPLLNEEDEIVGITSWGTGCALRNKPGVYTNVANYNTFIRQSICALADDKPDYCDSLDFSNINVESGGSCDEDSTDADTDRVCEGGFLSCLVDLFILFAGALFSCFG